MPRPVVLLHGWGGSPEATFGRAGWSTEVQWSGAKVHALVLPAHGPAASRAPEDYGDLAAEVLDALPPGRADLVGYSLGAKIALEIAVRRPDRVGRLVLLGIGDNALRREPSADAVIEALEHGVSDGTPQAARDLVARAVQCQADPLALAALLRRHPNPIAGEDGLAEIRVPILLINGGEDLVALPDDELRRLLPEASYLRVAGVGHGALPESAEVIREAVSFLGGDASAEAARLDADQF